MNVLAAETVHANRNHTGFFGWPYLLPLNGSHLSGRLFFPIPTMGMEQESLAALAVVLGRPSAASERTQCLSPGHIIAITTMPQVLSPLQQQLLWLSRVLAQDPASFLWLGDCHRVCINYQNSLTALTCDALAGSNLVFHDCFWGFF